MLSENEPGEKYSILVIDPKPGLRDAAQSLDFLRVATHGREARKNIADPRRNFAAILINPIISTPGAIPLIHAAHHYRPGTPIFALSSEKVHFGQEEIHRLALAGNFTLPRRLEEIKDLVSNEILSFTPIAKFPCNEHLRSRPAPELSDDGAYVAAPALDFLSGIASPFDVFVRLQSGRYLKVANARNVFEPERVLVYLIKGVTHFYLAKSSHQRCLTYCDLMARFLLDHSGVSPDMKLSHTFNLGQKLVESIRDEGLRNEHVDFAYSFINESYAWVRKIKLGKDVTVRSFLEEVSASEHAVGTALVASLLTLPLQIETRSAFMTVGLASIFHDIGLHVMERKFKNENVRSMGEEERKAFQEHPKVGARFIAGFEGIDEAVSLAIAKHHERRNNSGFPKIDHSNELNRIAEIVGISDEFVRMVTSNRNAAEIFHEMTETVFDGFSYPVIEAFKQVFMTPPRKIRRTA